MNTKLTNKHNVFGDLGDFWYRQVNTTSTTGGVGFARSFSHLCDATTAVDGVDVIAKRVTGDNINYEANVTIPFNPASVYTINLDLSTRSVTGTLPSITITRPGKYTLTDVAALQIDNLTASPPDASEYTIDGVLGDTEIPYLFFPVQDSNVVVNSQEARPLYYIPIPIHISPVAVLSKTRELSVGSSFTTHPGYMLFYESPHTLFPDNVIVCRSAYVTSKNINKYTLQTDGITSTGKYIARYMRATHSAVALRLALAESAMLPILEEDSTLEYVYNTQLETVYEFDTCVLRVPYYVEHPALIVGETYDAGTIIGEDYIKVFSASSTPASPSWYRHADLQTTWTSSGFDISTLTPFTVTVPDATCTFQTNGTVPHLKMSGFTGGGTSDYWTFVNQSETYTGKYIASVTGATAGATANALDFYFDNMLSNNTIIIKLRTQELGHVAHSNVLSFIRRDLPINVTPIILQ